MSVSGMALAYPVNVPMSKTLAGALLLLAAKPLAAQFPRQHVVIFEKQTDFP